MAEPQAKLDAFPVFMLMKGRIVTIVGGGREAFAKARLLSQSSATLRIVAPTLDYDFAEWLAERGGIAYEVCAFKSEHLEGAVLAIAATGDETIDLAVVEAARRAGIKVNAVDRPHLCDVYMPALVNRAPVAVAIGTEGAGPVLAQMIRATVEQILAPSLGQLASIAATYRGTVERLLPPGQARRRFWQGFFGGEPARAVEAGDLSLARRETSRLLERSGGAAGHVATIAVGPSADLLTLRAHRLMMSADVVVHDDSVAEAILALGRRDAERVSAGQRRDTGALLVALARDGKRVVRLAQTEGEGFATDEVDALRTAHVPFEIVPAVAEDRPRLAARRPAIAKA